MFEFIAKYAPQLIMAGIKYTVPLALISFVIAVIIAAIVAMLRSYVPHATGIKSIGCVHVAFSDRYFIGLC